MANRRRDRTTWGRGRRRRRIAGAILAGLCALLAVAATTAYLPTESTSTQEADAKEEAPKQPATSTNKEEKADTSSNNKADASATKADKKEKTKANKEEKKFDVVLGEFRTDYRYSNSEARRYNLSLASGAVNGTVLAPGETFSMNDHISDLDYKDALVFADGGETKASGGGLCQVTSTVYMAAQYAGLEIVERNPHYAVLPYIRPGFDATVWFGNSQGQELDMKFKNTTSGDILVREWVDDKGFLRAEIRAHKDNGKEVEMRSEQVFRDLDRGIKWRAYKTVKKDGEVLFDGLIHENLYSFPPSKGDPDKYNDVRTGGW